MVWAEMAMYFPVMREKQIWMKWDPLFIFFHIGGRFTLIHRKFSNEVRNVKYWEKSPGYNQ
jgi:hypothetical protein